MNKATSEAVIIADQFESKIKTLFTTHHPILFNNSELNYSSSKENKRERSEGSGWTTDASDWGHNRMNQLITIKSEELMHEELLKCFLMDSGQNFDIVSIFPELLSYMREIEPEILHMSELGKTVRVSTIGNVGPISGVKFVPNNYCNSMSLDFLQRNGFDVKFTNRGTCRMTIKNHITKKRIFGLWFNRLYWITPERVYDIIYRGGDTVGEALQRAAREGRDTRSVSRVEAEPERWGTETVSQVRERRIALVKPHDEDGVVFMMNQDMMWPNPINGIKWMLIDTGTTFTCLSKLRMLDEVDWSKSRVTRCNPVGTYMMIEGMGRFGKFKNISVCTRGHDVIAGADLTDAGYEISAKTNSDVLWIIHAATKHVTKAIKFGQEYFITELDWDTMAHMEPHAMGEPSSEVSTDEYEDETMPELLSNEKMSVADVHDGQEWSIQNAQAALDDGDKYKDMPELHWGGAAAMEYIDDTVIHQSREGAAICMLRDEANRL